jgi:hypothetical protein
MASKRTQAPPLRRCKRGAGTLATVLSSLAQALADCTFFGPGARPRTLGIRPFARRFLGHFFRPHRPLNFSTNQYIKWDQFVLYGTRFSCQTKTLLIAGFRTES